MGASFGDGDPDEMEWSLDELEALADTAGAEALDRVTQRRDSPDPATYIGKGKVEEIRVLAEEVDCDTVVFDDELSPAQQLNLEKILGRSAIDRCSRVLPASRVAGRLCGLREELLVACVA